MLPPPCGRARLSPSPSKTLIRSTGTAPSPAYGKAQRLTAASVLRGNADPAGRQTRPSHLNTAPRMPAWSKGKARTAGYGVGDRNLVSMSDRLWPSFEKLDPDWNYRKPVKGKRQLNGTLAISAAKAAEQSFRKDGGASPITPAGNRADG